MTPKTESEIQEERQRDFRESQAISAKRVAFSVTRQCPLRCEHCCVSASPERKDTAFSAEFGEHVASQMQDLHRIGVRYVDFTGGEPTLAKQFVKPVARAARALGMRTGMVSAGHWAKNQKTALRLLDELDDVEEWNLSTDVYHLPFVSLETVERAFLMLKERGKKPRIRIAHSEEMSRGDAEIITRCHEFAGEDMGFQPVGKVGRADGLVQLRRAALPELDRTPCPTTGPLVQPNGSVEPCCAPAAEEGYEHPMQVGNAFRDSLCKIVMRWRTHPLIQAIRLWGFGPLLEWMQAEGMTVDALCHDRNCMTCVHLLRDRALAEQAYRITARPDKRILIAAALLETFNEPWMARQLELAARRAQRDTGAAPERLSARAIRAASDLP